MYLITLIQTRKIETVKDREKYEIIRHTLFLTQVFYFPSHYSIHEATYLLHYFNSNKKKRDSQK